MKEKLEQIYTCAAQEIDNAKTMQDLEDVKLKDFSWDRYNKILLDRKISGEKLYNDAYISCATKAYGYDLKHQNHLAYLKKCF